MRFSRRFGLLDCLAVWTCSRYHRFDKLTALIFTTELTPTYKSTRRHNPKAHHRLEEQLVRNERMLQCASLSGEPTSLFARHCAGVTAANSCRWITVSNISRKCFTVVSTQNKNNDTDHSPNEINEKVRIAWLASELIPCLRSIKPYSERHESSPHPPNLPL
jgi:hypothetical protein